MIMLDLLKIQETGQHIRNSRMKQGHDAYCNHMFDATYTITTKGFGPILRTFNMTFQT